MASITPLPTELLPAQAEAYRKQNGRPFVTLSYAQSLDGCLTLHQGSASPVSSHNSMVITHQLRAAHDAILVGIGTILADNPRLNVRLAPGDSPRPIVLDSQLRIPRDAAFIAQQRDPLIATTTHAPQARRQLFQQKGIQLMTLPPDPTGRVELPALLTQLAASGINSLMVEGGATVLTSFIRQQLFNRVIVTIAPVFAAGYHAIQPMGFTHWHDLPRLHQLTAVPSEGDLIVWGDRP